MSLHYPESKQILEKIKGAQRIVLNVHRKPDPDTVGSSLALSYYIQSLGKETTLVCPNKIGEEYGFLKQATKIKTVSLSTFDFSPYDLFIILDSSSWHMVADSHNFTPPSLPTIIIDHHKTNNLEVEIKLLDIKAPAVGEIVYNLLKDIGADIDADTATALFTAIAGDTVYFKHTPHPAQTFEIATKLLEKGARQDLYIQYMTSNHPLSFIKCLGKMLEHMEYDAEHKFVYAAMPFEEYETYGKPSGVKDAVANEFLQAVKDAEFGVAILEGEKDRLFVSLRSKGKVDVSTIALHFGGGGHKVAAGFSIKGEFMHSVEKILSHIRTYNS
ncbi:MAG: bifunctional oligoribonuclease/PAP phosphatase NrnA [bacterium]|nr:bifunctional oligoribonuclease/PAP phosphatase NrnA [bacterium]